MKSQESKTTIASRHFQQQPEDHQPFFGKANGSPAIQRKPFFHPPLIQPQLTINEPGDPYEQEADDVANQIMRMREGDTPILQRIPLTYVNGLMRKCAGCEEEEKKGIQRKETGGGDASGKAAPSIVSNVLSSGSGQPMDGGTRQFMETRFGQDFTQVRIHTDSRAAESASAIQARAYTSGSNVVFGSGEYQPASEGGRRLLAHELVHVGQQEGESGRLQRDDGGGSAADPVIAVGDIADNVEHKYVLLKKESKEIKLGKYAAGKFTLKLSMIRGKSPGAKGSTDINIPGTDSDASVTASAKIGTLETDPLFEKYAMKIGSFAGEGDIDLGCKLKLKLSVDLVKIEGSGEVKFGLPSPSAYARLEKSDFDNPSGCLITEMLSHGGSGVPVLVHQGWMVDVELKFDISLDPVEMAKAIAIKKAEEELKDLGKKADDLAAKASKAQKDWEGRGSRRQRAQRKGKWNTSKQAKKLKKEAEDIAKKIAGKTDDIAKLGKGMKSPWGRKFVEKSLGWAKSFGLKALGKVLVVLAVLDALVSIAKIIKYWDQIEFKWPWDSSGTSLDDAPLFGDAPSGGTPGQEGSDGGTTPTGTTDLGTSSADGGTTDGGQTSGQSGAMDPGADELGAKEAGGTATPGSEPADSGQKDDGDGLTTPDQTTGSKDGPAGQKDEEDAGEKLPPISSQTLEKIRNRPEPVQELIMEMLLGEKGIKPTDTDIEEVLKRIPDDLTKEQSQQLMDALQSSEGKTIDEVLKNLEAAVKAVKTGTLTNHPDTDAGVVPKPTDAEPEPIVPSEEGASAAPKPTEPDDAGSQHKESKIPAAENTPTTAKPKSTEQTTSSTEPKPVGPSKMDLHSYIVGKVFVRGVDKKFTVVPGAVDKLKKEGMHWQDPQIGKIGFSVNDIITNFSELSDSSDPNHNFQKIEINTVLTVAWVRAKGDNKLQFKQGQVLTTSTAYINDPVIGEMNEISTSPATQKLLEILDITDQAMVIKPSARGVVHDFGDFWAKVEIRAEGKDLKQITFYPTKLNDPEAYFIVRGTVLWVKVGTPLIIDL